MRVRAKEMVESSPVGSGRTFLAVVFSILVSGSGHALLGRIRRALIWLSVASVFLVFVGYSELAMWIGVFGIRVASAFDCWIVARGPAKLPSTRVVIRNVLIVMGLAFSTHLVARAYLAEAFKIPSVAMVPTLHVGDYLMANKIDTSPERGKVVVFVYPCDPRKDFVKRVVALENDTVEVRCDLLYVNGELVPQSRVGNGTYWDWEMGYEGKQWREEEYSLYNESLGEFDYQVAQSPQEMSLGVRESLHDFPGTRLPSCRNTVEGAAGSSPPIGSLIETGPGGSCSPSRSFKVPEGHFFVMGDNRSNSSDSRVWGAIPNEAIRGSFSYIWYSERHQ